MARIQPNFTNVYDSNVLFNLIYQACNTLRGPIYPEEYKTYIFPLLFYKRICDVYNEEIQFALEESDGDIEYAMFPENHRFIITDGCRWEDVRSKSENIGHALQNAMRGVEKANPRTLISIFNDFDDAKWTNKDRLSDERLKDLIEHFSSLVLDESHCVDDVMGKAYEYLIKKFADLTNKKAGEFYTPRPVVTLMVRIVDPKPGETVYDPACGTGGILIESRNHIGDDKLTLGKLYGQEKNLSTSAIARMNLFLHGAEDFHIYRGDTLRNPAFLSHDSLQTFDCVVSNPPFSLENWGDEIWASDRYGRNFLGIPPAKTGDFAWIQHMIKSMKPKKGRMAVVLPQGVLFRAAKEGEIRKKLLEMDLLDTVIGLGPNLFYGTGLSACVLILRQDKPANRKKKVMFVDASKTYKAGRAQNELLDEHVDQIYTWATEYRDIEGVCRLVSLDEIRKNDYNLNIPRYIEPIVEEESITIDEAIANLKQSMADAYEAEENLKNLLRKEGLMA